jgi:hypothetical protein
MSVTSGPTGGCPVTFAVLVKLVEPAVTVQS